MKHVDGDMLFEDGYKTVEKRRDTNLLPALRGGERFYVGWLKIVAFLLKGTGRGESREEARKSSLENVIILAGQRSAKSFVDLITFATQNHSAGLHCVEPDFSALLCKRVHFALWVCSALPFLRMNAFVSFNLTHFIVFLCALM